MEKDYTLYPLNVSFNGSGITVDVDNDFVEFEYEYVPTVSYYKPSVKTAKRKSNQIILLPPF